MVNRIDHIGIAVRNLEAAVEKYRALFGKEPERLEEVPEQDVTVAMFRAGETAVELLEGRSVESPIRKFINKHGEGIHHICLAVQNLDAALNAAERAGFERIPLPSDRGAGGHLVAFLHPKSTGGVLIELVEK